MYWALLDSKRYSEQNELRIKLAKRRQKDFTQKFEQAVTYGKAEHFYSTK